MKLFFVFRASFVSVLLLRAGASAPPPSYPPECAGDDDQVIQGCLDSMSPCFNDAVDDADNDACIAAGRTCLTDAGVSTGCVDAMVPTKPAAGSKRTRFYPLLVGRMDQRVSLSHKRLERLEASQAH